MQVPRSFPWLFDASSIQPNLDIEVRRGTAMCCLCRASRPRRLFRSTERQHFDLNDAVFDAAGHIFNPQHRQRKHLQNHTATDQMIDSPICSAV